MQIIFDSEEQKEKLVELINSLEGCPSDLGLKDDCVESTGNCRVCWKTALESVEKKEE